MHNTLFNKFVGKATKDDKKEEDKWVSSKLSMECYGCEWGYGYEYGLWVWIMSLDNEVNV